MGSMRSKKPKLVKLVGAVSPTLPVSMSSDQDSVSATEAARELNISSRSFRRLAEAGKIPSFRTPGGYVRVRRGDLDTFKSLSSSIAPAIPSRVDGAREENQMLSLELQHKKLRRDLRRVDEEDAEVERKRATAVAAEQARSEAARAQARLEQEEREQQEQEEWARQAEFDRRQQWADSWLAYGLTSLPVDLPREFMLEVQPAIEDTLRTLSPTRPPAIVQQLVLAGIQRVIAPWQRQREIEQAIKQATKELPWDVRQYSDMFPDLFPPTEWEARALSAAREAVSHLAGNVSLAEIHAAAVAAGRQVASEYVAEQARVREEKQCAAGRGGSRTRRTATGCEQSFSSIARSCGSRKALARTANAG